MPLANVLCHRAVPDSHTGDIPDFDPGLPGFAPHQLGETQCCFVLAQCSPAVLWANQLRRHTQWGNGSRLSLGGVG
jgi:hypothetical protein